MGGLGRLLGGLWEVLWRSLKDFCDLGGFLEALGGLWIDFWRPLDGFGIQHDANFDPKLKKKRSTILIGFWYRFLMFF